MGKPRVMDDSGHVLHVIGSMTLTELRDAQVLSGFIKLQNRTKHLSYFTHLYPRHVADAGALITFSLFSGPSMETSSISSPMLSSLFDRSDR